MLLLYTKDDDQSFKLYTLSCLFMKKDRFLLIEEVVTIFFCLPEYFVVIFTEKEIDVTREQNLAELARAHLFIVIDG